VRIVMGGGCYTINFQRLIVSLMLDRRLSVAPMMGCTDRHCRYLFRLLSPNALLYSEMVVTGALLHGDAAKFLQHADDAPCAFQLGGSDPEALAQAAKLIEDAGYQEVNLNCGCPSDRVQVGGIGACLMAEPELVARCFQAMSQAVDIPVSIKSRIGIDDQDDYGFFSHFVATLHDAGCRTFIVHARKALLHGLSPKENREIPPLKYDYVFEAIEDFPDASFSLNGGIKTVEQVSTLHQQLANDRHGLMLGRAPYADPFLLAQADNVLYGTPCPSRLDVLSEYRQYVAAQMDLGVEFKHMAKHLLGYFTGYRGARHFRRHLSTHMFKPGTSVSLLDDALAESRMTQNFAEELAS
jgi:tRNA-dihydrouridine synthase A